MCAFLCFKPVKKRYVAFPASYVRFSINLNIYSDDFEGSWRILSGPTESGLYLLEATDDAIERLRMLYAGRYILMEDF